MQSVKSVKFLLPIALLSFWFVGCASGFLKYEKSDSMKEMAEFDQAVKIEAPPEETPGPDVSVPAPSPSPGVSPAATPTVALKAKATPTPAKKEKQSKKSKKNEPAVDPNKHEPELEGQAGFTGRRPTKDPFRVGEKLVYEITYFGAKAGDLILSSKPYATVNGRKSYNFQMELKTSPLFANFYEVDDKVVSMMDFETMMPSVFTLHVKETGQLREARFLHDWPNKQVSYWEKKVTKKDGAEEKKQKWEVPDYTQDVFSAAFYLRVFNWEVGKQNAFRVADNEDNLIFKATALRKETFSSRAGNFPAVVIKPEVQLRGQFKPMGDIFIWLSDDDRHYILRIEAKIKIGTIVAQLTQLTPGRDESP